MPDFLSVFERTLKAVRFGIFQASDQLALALDGLCRAPEVYPRYEMTAPGSFVIPDSAAGSPQNAADDPAGGDLAPTPEAGATKPAGSPSSHQRDLPPPQHLLRDGARAIELWLNGVPSNFRSEWQLHAVYMRQLAEDLEAQK